MPDCLLQRSLITSFGKQLTSNKAQMATAANHQSLMIVTFSPLLVHVGPFSPVFFLLLLSLFHQANFTVKRISLKVALPKRYVAQSEGTALWRDAMLLQMIKSNRTVNTFECRSPFLDHQWSMWWMQLSILVADNNNNKRKIDGRVDSDIDDALFRCSAAVTCLNWSLLANERWPTLVHSALAE